MKKNYKKQDLQNNEALQFHKVELTPELADKIWKGIQKKRYDEQVSKDAVLHYLKQLKAQMGKELKNAVTDLRKGGIKTCMDMIDKKIAKINKQ